MSKPTSNSDMTNKQENNLTINDLFRFSDLYFYKKNYMYRHLYDSYNKFLEEDIPLFLTGSDHVFNVVLKNRFCRWMNLLFFFGRFDMIHQISLHT